MANRVFQNVVYQMKDAVDRVVGVIDETGTVISCSELGQIGEVREGVAAVRQTAGDAFVRDGYAYPFPSYTYRWQTPNATPIYFDISLVNDSRLPADIVQQVKNAVVSAFAGLDGKQRAQIGTNIYAGRYYSAVQSVHSAVQISGLTIGKTSGAGQGAIEVGIDEMPTLDLSNINVTVA